VFTCNAEQTKGPTINALNREYHKALKQEYKALKQDSTRGMNVENRRKLKGGLYRTDLLNAREPSMIYDTRTGALHIPNALQHQSKHFGITAD
jgi:hypothetical protein